MMRIEIKSREEFWRDAVIVEWEHQYPQRKLVKEASGSFLIENDWLDDLNRIAGDCFSTIVVAPTDPSRRSWFRQFLPRES
jgi:hypothetical protein